LSGAGQLRARGGSGSHSSYASGAGGRVSVYAVDRSGFSGVYNVASGATGQVSGAGTIYLRDATQTYGELIVNNAGRAAAAGSTPIRHVGRHMITAVDEVSPGIWKVEVAGTPWKPTSAQYDWGVDGLQVDLDASDDLGPYYSIVSNTGNSLTLRTFDDLTNITGQELRGVHFFNVLTIQNGASVDFGGDRVEEVGSQPVVNDADNDGLSDEEELTYATNPANPDTDGDQVIDGLEVALGLSPTDLNDNDISAAAVNLVVEPELPETIDLSQGQNQITLTPYAIVEAGSETYKVDISDEAFFAVSYQSSNTAVITPAGNGVYQALSAGSSDLSIQFAGYSVMVPVTVIGIVGESWVDTNVSIDQDTTVESLNIRNSSVIGDHVLTVNGDALVEGATGSAIQLDSLIVTGNLTVSGVTLILNIENEFRVDGDLNLINGATLTVPAADANTATLNRMVINVAGSVLVDASSKIDVSGKGYPPDYWSGPDFSSNTRRGCHGGIQRGYGSSDCTYGRYVRARYAGSAGRYYDASNPAHGGGFVELTAQSLQLEGAIVANGANTQWRTEGAGAGGGIHVDVETLAGSGRMQVQGGSGNNNNYPSGAGGRISVYAVERSGFNGGFDISAGVSGEVSGAGTLFIRDPNAAYGHLQASNWNRTALSGSTPIRSVGRHTITGIDEVSPGVWRIEVAGNPWQVSDPALDWGLGGIEVDLDGTEQSSPLYTIVSNTTNVLTLHTSDDLSGLIGSELIGVHTFETLRVVNGASVDFGEDRIVINDLVNSVIGSNSELRLGQAGTSVLSLVSGGGSLVMSDAVLIDRALVLDQSGNGSVHIKGATDFDSVAISSGQITFSEPLTVSGALTVGGNAVVKALDVTAGTVTVTDATLESELLSADELTLSGAATLTTPPASAGASRLYGLLLNVAGAVHVDMNSKIDVSGKGYPPDYWSGPDFSNNTRRGCHGGIQRGYGSSDCTYGRYARARYAGSAGYHYDANNRGEGGGILELVAGSVQVDGQILASGTQSAWSTNGAGAGGSIHIEAASLSGVGQIQVRGGSMNNNNYPAGAGGRISVYVEDRSGYTGSYNAAAGSVGSISGAGTVYLQHPAEAYGHLYVTNAGRVALSGSTPIRSVGRHQITGVDEVSPGVWRIEVAGTPWKASNPALGWGIDGIDVDLDASELASPLYKIVTNTTNTITINTTDDISGVIGNELVGVHTFSRLTVVNGASVDFGEDRYAILDTNNSNSNGTGQILSGETLELGSISVLAGEEIRYDGRDVIVRGDVTVDGGTLLFGVDRQITVEGNVIVTGGGAITTPYASTHSPARLYPLNMTVTGEVVIDASSKIDVSGKGYPPDYWSGPDFSNNTRRGCHGGIQRGYGSSDCTYGRYARARYAGSAGYHYDANNRGEGGGILELVAGSVQVDGQILASGTQSAWSANGAGAGGSIHIEAASLSGAGQIQARGGAMNNNSYPAGAGGRISVYVEDRSGYTGSYNAAAGSVGSISGAGTVYLQHPADAYGHLYVTNAGRVALSGSTPIRSVGRHQITGVDEVSPGVWRIEVADNPWKASNPALGWGIDGIDVDLDASELNSPHYVIQTNTANTLTVNTTDDLSGVVNSELVGVHILQTLNVSSGAQVTFNADRVIVNALPGSAIDASSTVQASPDSVLP
ncbi:MAG TPA: thrombospondin type 3 repeat-containing protein, partial [Gammaproteobacteria bacterium]